MTEEQDRWKNFFYSRWFLVVWLILIILSFLAFFKSYYQDYQVREEIRRLTEEKERLEAKKIQSIEILKYVQSKNFVEDKARTEFNLAKPGEQAVIITSAQTLPEDNRQVDNQVVKWKSISNPLKWWKLFFNKNSN